MFKLADLDREKLDTLREFEEQRGLKVLAYAPIEAAPAPLDEGQLRELRGLEECLGVTLVAYR